MTPKQWYEKYKGKTFKLGNVEGIVCGYADYEYNFDSYEYFLLMAITKGAFGFEKSMCNPIIVTHQNNPLGYYWVTPNSIENERTRTLPNSL